MKVCQISKEKANSYVKAEAGEHVKRSLMYFLKVRDIAKKSYLQKVSDWLLAV